MNIVLQYKCIKDFVSKNHFTVKKGEIMNYVGMVMANERIYKGYFYSLFLPEDVLKDNPDFFTPLEQEEEVKYVVIKDFSRYKWYC